MADTQNLKDMLDSLINGKPEQAQTVFHTYLQDKIKDVFGTKEAPAVDPSQATEKSEE